MRERRLKERVIVRLNRAYLSIFLFGSQYIINRQQQGIMLLTGRFLIDLGRIWLAYIARHHEHGTRFYS
jgi:hypothetical protein